MGPLLTHRTTNYMLYIDMYVVWAPLQYITSLSQSVVSVSMVTRTHRHQGKQLWKIRMQLHKVLCLDNVAVFVQCTAASGRTDAPPMVRKTATVSVAGCGGAWAAGAPKRVEVDARPAAQTSKKSREKPLPASVDEMPKLEERSAKVLQSRLSSQYICISLG